MLNGGSAPVERAKDMRRRGGAMFSGTRKGILVPISLAQAVIRPSWVLAAAGAEDHLTQGMWQPGITYQPPSGPLTKP